MQRSNTLRAARTRGGARLRFVTAPFLVLGVLLANVSTAAAQTTNQAIEPDARVSADVFPIFPWDRLRPDPATLQEARDCGFNLAGFAPPDALDAVNAAGLQCFVTDPSIDVRGAKLTDDEVAQRVNALIARTAGHPAVFGYHLIDEPPAPLVPQVARWAKAFQEKAPRAAAYVNFLPIAGNASGDGAVERTYENYLTSFLEPVRPAAFSFDYYSMLDDGTVRPTYFDCLEVVRRASLKTGIPFWHVVLANSHFRYAEPTAATLRFQVFTSLAYGARGIGYFTYSGRDRGNYRCTAIDLSGRRTPTWDLLRDVNQQLHRIAPAYVQLKSVNVFHHPEVPIGCRGIAESKFVAQLRGKGPFVVGEFEDQQGRPALIVVNRDLAHSTQFTVVPKSPATLLRVSSFTPTTRPMGAEDDWLAPGQGLLLQLAPKAQAP